MSKVKQGSNGRATQRQYIMEPFEADAYARWYNAHSKDPSRIYLDPVAAFRAQTRKH